MAESKPSAPPKLKELLDRDPHLHEYSPKIIKRYQLYAKLLTQINDNEGGLLEFSDSYKKFGINRNESDTGLTLREWLPSAQAVNLFGEFNDWNRSSHACSKNDFGVWTLELLDVDGEPAIPTGSKVKLAVTTAQGEVVERIPAWINRAVPSEAKTYYEGVYQPRPEYDFRHTRPPLTSAPKIYEAHIGIAGEEPAIASYNNFTDNVLPRIAKGGYNVIQLMAVMEHAYYGCFGYQVTSFFAASSRFGASEDLCRLIDTAHGYGIVVLLDVVHSHASKNTLDGLNMYDGSDAGYFHSGGRGFHNLWDSRLFNYTGWETLRFLLSNLRYYMEVYRFDGFRFDGVTSMLYLHHGLGRVFTSYHDYFDDSVDLEASVYLMLANRLVHEVYSNAITIAEEVSGMPALCRPIEEGGFGFDYKLGMAIPDMWIKILKEMKDEEWDMGNIVHTLENRRHMEPTIAYAESHDQALVGDKTIAFWLMDKEMYTHMSVLSEPSLVVDRGLALHKMIRLITHSLGGEGYLNFIGNEFGHPEWLDFPREGNGESYMHARRQWHLVDDDLLKYKFMGRFDSVMNTTEAEYGWLSAGPAYVSLKHEGDKVIVFERAGLVFAFNFHWDKSYQDYKIGVQDAGTYVPVLDTDEEEFGGHSRVAKDVKHFTSPEPWNDRANSMMIYLPSRCGIVFRRLPE